MNLQEFVSGLADIEGKEATQEYVKTFWKQASEEDQKTIVLAIDQLCGHLRKVVKSFWALCDIHITDGWITIDGRSYCVTPEIKPDDGKVRSLYKLVRPTEATQKPIRVLEGGVRVDEQTNIIKNDMTYKVRGE